MTKPDKDIESAIKYRIDRAYECINEVEFLILHNKLRLAVTRIYYGMFYIVAALALFHNYKTSKHQQLIGWFNKEFINNQIFPLKYGKFFRDAFARRADVDYGDIVDYQSNDVQEWFEQMKDFIETVKDRLP